VTVSALPWLSMGVLREATGTIVQAQVPCSIWPVSQRSEAAGEVFDHTGECPGRFAADVVQRVNLRLAVDGDEYVIVGATKHGLVISHVALLLRRSRPVG
jgi:hypothetical protein